MALMTRVLRLVARAGLSISRALGPRTGGCARRSAYPKPLTAWGILGYFSSCPPAGPHVDDHRSIPLGLDQVAACRRDSHVAHEAGVDGVTIEQAASFLGLSPVRVRECIREGVLKAERVAPSDRWAIDTDSLAALAMRCSTGRGLRRLIRRRFRLPWHPGTSSSRR